MPALLHKESDNLLELLRREAGSPTLSAVVSPPVSLRLAKPVPKKAPAISTNPTEDTTYKTGQHPRKYKSCVRQVADQGQANPYAVCNPLKSLRDLLSKVDLITEKDGSKKLKVKISGDPKDVKELMGKPDETGLSTGLLGKAEKKPKLGTGERFKALAGKLAAQGTSDPDALAAAIGRKRWGAKKFARLSLHGRSS